MKKGTKKENLKDRVVHEITSGVVAGKYPVGSKLPPERELAEKMGVSRTVVRSGLTELAQAGVIQQKGRQGCIVADYLTDGRMQIVNAILTCDGEISQHILEGYFGARVLIESETAKLAALNRSNDDLYRMFTTIREGHEIADGDLVSLANQEFRFHKQIAVASGNAFYPILINSHENLALKLLEKMYCTSMKRTDILRLQECLYNAIQERDPDKAVQAMRNMFEHRLPE